MDRPEMKDTAQRLSTEGKPGSTGADALCDTLLAAGVDTCFANPGTSEMHFVAALDRKPAMRCVLGLFEGVVTGAADGYARMAGKPAATLLHTGPGLANGLANLHNARRAHTPMINVVGDHAGYHVALDAPLTSDIDSLARPMSNWVRRVSHGTVSRDTADAIAAARGEPGGIATLILPADVAWGPSDAALVTPAAPRRSRVPAAAVEAAARALRSGRKALLLLGDSALLAEPLEAAGRIAEATGARLMAEQSNRRIARGAGRVDIPCRPYPVDLALKAVEGVEVMILVGARAPVAFFAYPGKPGSLVPPGCEVLTLAEPGQDMQEALEAVSSALSLPASARAKLSPFAPPPLPQDDGALTPSTIAQAVGALLPEGAVIINEAITSGAEIAPLTATAAPHDMLALTGGAIGDGLPMATGAAIGAPGRKVIAMQADGSGMYTVQALGTQARERLNIVNIIYANREYAILRGELANVGAGAPGVNATRMLDLGNPDIDWVKLAAGMGVEGVRVATPKAFGAALRAALSQEGPFLIEAVI